MDKLLLHNVTVQQLRHIIVQPSHTIALTGLKGAGKAAVAIQIASELLQIAPDRLLSYPYYRHFIPENNVLSIENAREIVAFTKLKTSGDGKIRRVILIEDATKLTIEAQNALLKTFEEPPADTVFILTIQNTSGILPTILSRVQTTAIQLPTKQATLEYYGALGHDSKLIEQYYFMSNGLPGLMHTLLSDSDNHPLLSAMKQAKSILQTDNFERLTMIDEIVKQKQTADIVAAISQISRTALSVEAARKESNDVVLKRWTSVLQHTEEAKELLQGNAQAKLVLTNLFLHL